MFAALVWRLRRGLQRCSSEHLGGLVGIRRLHYMHYNFARVHQALTIVNDDGTRTKRTPAMAAGIADHVWTLREIAALLDSN